MLDWIPARLTVAILSFFGFQCLYLIRYNLSVISIAMISNQNNCNYTLTENVTDCVATEGATTVDWDQRTRGLVLGSFFYGYACTQIIGGRLAETYGPKYVFGTAVSVPGVLTLLFPLAAKHHYITAFILRVLQGLIQGMSFPAMHALMSKWIPPIERSRYVGIIYLGSTLSIVITLPLCGFIVEMMSWEAAFLITGLIPLVWAIFWFSLFHNEPSEHPRISQKEKDFIENCTFASGTSSHKEKNSIPWKGILTNLPYMSSVLYDIGNSYGLSFLATQLPNYMLSVFGFSVLQSGILSSIPFMFRYVGGVIFSCIIDKLISTSKLSVTNARRYFSTIAMIIPGIIMIILPTLSGVTLTIILLCFLNFCNGASAGTQLVNATDLAPNFSGTLFGISNTFGSIASFLSPLITGIIIQESNTQAEWKIAFWICSPLYIVFEIIYAIFVSGEVQSFNFYHKNKDESIHMDTIRQSTKDESNFRDTLLQDR